MEKLFSKKDRGEATLITVIVLIVVAIGLLVIFRNGVKGIIDDVMDKVTKAVNSLFNGTGTSSLPTTPTT